MQLWTQGTRLLKDAFGRLILCGTCPCDTGCRPVSLNAVLTGSSVSEGVVGGYIYYNPVKQMVSYPGSTAPFTILTNDLLIAYLYCRTTSGTANEWEVGRHYGKVSCPRCRGELMCIGWWRIDSGFKTR
jgi:hypothetical protein